VSFWRSAIALILLLGVAIPLAAPVAQLLADPAAWRGWTEADRLFALARNTLFLAGGTVALALPTGIASAVLLYRTDLPLSRLFRLVTLLTLFVPLPLFTSGWQAALGSGGWLPVPAWSGWAASWTPWGQGIGSAVWIHTVAALPWVILLAGQGLSWVERELEEDALTLMPPWRVLWHVTLPRARAALGASALWVGLQAATEIAVTDVMQVRTFAEEVYTQLVGGPEADDGIARATAVTLPLVLLVAIGVGCMAQFWERRLPARTTLLTPPLLFGLGRWRWPLALAAALLCGLLLAMPLGSLVRRAGLMGTPPHWSPFTLGHYLVRAGRPPEGWMLLDSLLLAAASGVVVATGGLLACWAARGSRWFRAGVLVLMAVAWAMPGPLLGLGLKTIIDRLLAITESRWLAVALYHGPSPVPLLWVDAIRFFPFAVAILWPIVRLLPAELHDAARVDGATPGQELRHVLWPLTSTVWLRAALAVAVLSLGELSAGKLVATPGLPGYATEIFTQMHYGVTNELAARCVLLLIVVAIGGTGVAGFGRHRYCFRIVS
jgi:iron(III) transport system permease protein